MRIQRIAPCLWFDGKAEEAVHFYISLFKNSRICGLTRYGKTGPGPEGSVLTIDFELDGQHFVALNGGPEFTFNEAVSFIVNCETQAEIDEYWDKLSAGGQQVQCGWLKDRFGVSWQVVPTAVTTMLQDPDGSKTDRVMKAILQMVKIDLARLQAAYEKP